MATYKTPGVYVVERNAFPNSVVQAPTGIPLFVGHTEKAGNDSGDSLTGVPTRVTSLMQFAQFFGGAPGTKAGYDNGRFFVSEKGYYLWRAVRMFYANGGGPCWIVSVGDYDTNPSRNALSEPFARNSASEKISEPDIVAVPDAMMLSNNAHIANVYKAALASSERMQDGKFVIMDVPDGASPLGTGSGFISDFRTNIGNDSLNFGAAYYPWLRTSLETETSLALCDETAVARLKELVTADLPDDRGEEINQQITDALTALSDAQTALDAARDADPQDAEAIRSATAALSSAHAGLARHHAAASAASPAYNTAMQRILRAVNLQPSCGAIAGVYTRTDTNTGIFKAPANTGIQNVIEPAAQISDEQQADLNVPLNGKAINAIRTFTGRGVLIWGARTLDGNSADWRYISVRRTLLMFERSIRAACEAYVFEPNTAQTWVTVKTMIQNFLTNQWKEGALAGATPEQAFAVRIGLGETMTADDINNGLLRVEIAVAVTRPAEFIVLTFQQKMQTS